MRGAYASADDEIGFVSRLADDLVARGAWEGFDFAVEGRELRWVSQHGVELARHHERPHWTLFVCDPVGRQRRSADDPAELADDFVSLVADIMMRRGRVLAPAGAPAPPILSQDEADVVLVDLAEELDAARIPEGYAFAVRGVGGESGRPRRPQWGSEAINVEFAGGQFRVWHNDMGDTRTIVISPRPEVACQVMRRECLKLVDERRWTVRREALGPLADVTGWPEARW